MKKLTIVFNDGSKIVYTIKNFVPWENYFENHNRRDIKSATLQQYPKKDYEPVILVGGCQPKTVCNVNGVDCSGCTPCCGNRREGGGQ